MKKVKYIILKHHVNESIITRKIFQKYTLIYGQVIAFSPTNFGDFYIYIKLAEGQQITLF